MPEPHLPVAGVPAQKRDVPAPGDEPLDGLPHLERPVLVVADADVELVSVEYERRLKTRTPGG